MGLTIKIVTLYAQINTKFGKKTLLFERILGTIDLICE